MNVLNPLYCILEGIAPRHRGDERGGFGGSLAAPDEARNLRHQRHDRALVLGRNLNIHRAACKKRVSSMLWHVAGEVAAECTAACICNEAVRMAGLEADGWSCILHLDLRSR